MFDPEGCQYYLRSKISLENKLFETGDFRGISEVESQAHLTEERLVDRIKQAHSHARREIDAIRLILKELTQGG